MTKKERGNFGSKLGVILASAGSAVGPVSCTHLTLPTTERV